MNISKNFINQEFKKLKKNKTLLFSCIDNEDPLISYSPFVEVNNVFYIFVSDLSKHTKILKKSGHASIILIEDESITKEIFARKRVTLHCSTSKLIRNNKNWDNIILKLKSRFGDIIDTLNGLTDFHLIKFKPQHGSIILGFGKAYNISKEDLK